MGRVQGWGIWEEEGCGLPVMRSLSIPTDVFTAGRQDAGVPCAEGGVLLPFLTLSTSLSLPPPLPLKTLFVWSNFFNLLQSRTDPNYHISMCWSYVSAPN